jgi:hypothetical protein
LSPIRRDSPFLTQSDPTNGLSPNPLKPHHCWV